MPVAQTCPLRRVTILRITLGKLSFAMCRLADDLTAATVATAADHGDSKNEAKQPDAFLSLPSHTLHLRGFVCRA